MPPQLIFNFKHCSQQFLSLIAQDHFGVEYCTDEFYHPDLRGQPITQCSGVKYARIKYWLGDPYEDIESAFKKTLKKCNPGIVKAKALQHYGFYLGIRENWGEAKIYLRKAKEERTTNKRFFPYLAHRGLRLLEFDKRPFYPRPRD